jgi:hypothetical protein
MYCSCYSNIEVLQPSPLHEISSRDLRWKRDSLEIKKWSLNHFLGLSIMKIGVITFLIPRSGSCLQSVRSCRRE